MLAETNPKTNPRSPLDSHLRKKRTQNEPKTNLAKLLKIHYGEKRTQNGTGVLSGDAT